MGSCGKIESKLIIRHNKIQVRPVTHYTYFCMGFRVFRYWGHFLLLTLDAKNSATKVSNKRWPQKPENPETHATNMLRVTGLRVHLKYSCIKSHISTYKKCVGIITNRTVNNLNVQVVLHHLESWTRQWHYLLKRSFDDSVWPVEQAFIKYQHQLSTLCSNENRGPMIIYYHMLIPTEIDLDHYSSHPAITEIEKTISV